MLACILWSNEQVVGCGYVVGAIDKLWADEQIMGYGQVIDL